MFMAAASRMNVIGDNGLGEPEQDANSALTELDKGLRSGNVGEQCESIVRFPLWVLRVCQQSERHLDKILNVDEFVRRVFSVTHSNDPVRELGGELLQNYPAKDFILTSHDTLTKLATEALVDIPHQVSLLLSCLEGELRPEVKLHILRELKILATKGATQWPAGAVATLLLRAQEAANESRGGPILASCLDVLSVLAKSASVCQDQLQSDSALMDLCIQSCYSLQPKIVSNYAAGLPPLPAAPVLEVALESFLLLLVSESGVKHRTELRHCLKCVLQLCEACPARCEYFVQLIAEQMQGRMHHREPTMLLLMETLAAIASINPGNSKPPILLPLLPELLSCLQNMPKDAEQGSLVCTLVLLTCQGYSLSPEVCSSLYQYLQKCPVWGCYKLARAAMSSEHFHFWLLCLQEISLAECALLGESPVSSDHLSSGSVQDSSTVSPGCLLQRLTLANTHYVKAIAAIKASLSLLHPPPAIAMNQAQTSGDELLRHGRTTTQLRRVSQEFRQVAENHAKLAQSAFDADPKTLANINMSVKDCPEMHQVVTSCNLAAKIADDISSNRTIKPISYQHIESLLQQVRVITSSPLCLPRYFFQVLQSTLVKLSISPQSRLVGEITVQANTQMVLRVEGVCQHQGRPGFYRSITGVKLALSSSLQSSRSADSGKDTGTNITQVVHPHHDFFSAQFLLSFSQGGQYQICITASLIDADGQIWRTGPKTFLVVKVYEDQSQASTQVISKGFTPNSDSSRAVPPLPRF
ncbi:hypothetical protein B566_EDAN010742 [Ephemera danica]|nr:hypothetical protein B566_EDAN010742 [Ephemera danica]